MIARSKRGAHRRRNRVVAAYAPREREAARFASYAYDLSDAAAARFAAYKARPAFPIPLPRWCAWCTP